MTYVKLLEALGQPSPWKIVSGGFADSVAVAVLGSTRRTSCELTAVEGRKGALKELGSLFLVGQQDMDPIIPGL